MVSKNMAFTRYDNVIIIHSEIHVDWKSKDA